MRFLVRAVLVALLALAAACGRSDADAGGADPATLPPPRMVAVTDEPGATAAPDPAASAAAAPAPDDAGPARAPAADALRASVRHAQAREQALADARSELLDRFARGQEAFARLLREAYAARGEALLFHGDEAQRTQRDGVLALLRRLGDEAVPTKPYRLKRIAALVDEVERRAAAARALDGCDGMGATTAALCAAVTSAKAIPSAAEATERLRVDGLERVDPRLLGFVDEHLARRLELRRRWLEAEAELDVLLLRAFFQYVIDFRLVKRAHPDNVTRHPDEAPGDHREVLLAHLGKAGADPAGHLRSLRPALPLYERTVAALKRYRALVAAGGAPKLSRAKMKPGGRGESVTALKKRLALEGYYDGPVDDRYDRRLEDAVSAYQRLHGMKETGKVDTELYKSLEIPMERRVRSIELSLQRYRESEVRAGAELLIRVNIPQYEAEFWEGDRIVRRHRVIVGTTALDRNLQAGIEGKLNHTRMFSAEMATVVLNPYWAVPLRIKKYELDRELIKNPNYYQDNNFEVTELPNGEVMVKQGPGPGNALGRVKFLFPNEHAIYMHDTPKRHLFDRTFRAFSHGCIRTHEPIELAKWLLKRQNGWSPERVDQVLATKKERQVQLGRPVPITIEYNTVSVDEEGRVAFYDDVYGYDRAYWDGELPFVRSTKIAPEKLAKLHEQEEKWRSDLATRLAEPSDDPEGPTPPPPPGDGAGGGQPGDDGAGADDADQDGPAPKSLNEALGDRPPPKKKGAR